MSDEDQGQDVDQGADRVEGDQVQGDQAEGGDVVQGDKVEQPAGDDGRKGFQEGVEGK